MKLQRNRTENRLLHGNELIGALKSRRPFLGTEIASAFAHRAREIRQLSRVGHFVASKNLLLKIILKSHFSILETLDPGGGGRKLGSSEIRFCCVKKLSLPYFLY